MVRLLTWIKRKKHIYKIIVVLIILTSIFGVITRNIETSKQKKLNSANGKSKRVEQKFYDDVYKTEIEYEWTVKN